jgi:hypothetical protein
LLISPTTGGYAAYAIANSTTPFVTTGNSSLSATFIKIGAGSAQIISGGHLLIEGSAAAATGFTIIAGGIAESSTGLGLLAGIPTIIYGAAVAAPGSVAVVIGGLEAIHGAGEIISGLMSTGNPTDTPWFNTAIGVDDSHPIWPF